MPRSLSLTMGGALVLAVAVDMALEAVRKERRKLRLAGAALRESVAFERELLKVAEILPPVGPPGDAVGVPQGHA